MTLNDTNKYVGGTLINPPLYINNVNRDDMGEYSCSLRNEIGADISEDSIYLNVLCKYVEKRTNLKNGYEFLIFFMENNHIITKVTEDDYSNFLINVDLTMKILPSKGIWV